MSAQQTTGPRSKGSAYTGPSTEGPTDQGPVRCGPDIPGSAPLSGCLPERGFHFSGHSFGIHPNSLVNMDVSELVSHDRCARFDYLIVAAGVTGKFPRSFTWRTARSKRTRLCRGEFPTSVSARDPESSVATGPQGWLPRLEVVPEIRQRIDERLLRNCYSASDSACVGPLNPSSAQARSTAAHCGSCR